MDDPAGVEQVLFSPAIGNKETVMDLLYLGLCLGFALVTWLLIEGCARLGAKS